MGPGQSILKVAQTRPIRIQANVPEGDLGAVSLELAREIAANSEYGVWMTKKGLRANLDAASLRHAMELENRTQVLGYFSGCMEESMQAFQERRAPRWKKL